MRILSVHSHVASGHVGNDAVVLPLQLLGTEVLAVHTLQFSNHPGHGAFAGRVFPAADIAAVLAGLAAHGALDACDGVLSGYLGEATTADAVLEAAARVRAANPHALFLCDPVLGDDGRLYIPEVTATAIRDILVPAADIATPNAFELGFLTGMPTATRSEIVAAARALAPPTVLVTSADTAATPPGMVEMILCHEDGAWLLATPRLARTCHGAGDLLAGLFLFHCMALGDRVAALERAAATVFSVLTATGADAGDMSLVAARDAIIVPKADFKARPISLNAEGFCAPHG